VRRGFKEEEFKLGFVTQQRCYKDLHPVAARYEAMIITGELAENLHQRKFIPVLRDGDWQTSLPTWIKTRIGIDLMGDPYSDAEYESLLRAIHSETLNPPAVGPRPTFENSSGPPLSKVSAIRHSDLRIYPYEKSCFTLVTSLDRSQLMGMHVNLDLAVENRGNKGCATRHCRK
jgi:hypothetical protein